MRQLEKSAALNHASLAEYLENVNTRLMNQCLSTGGLAIGSGSKKKVLIASTVNFLAGGIFKTKTTAEVAFTATTHDIEASATLVKEACYLMCLAADGTPSLTMGEIASGAGEALVPEVPASVTPIGYVRVAVDAGSTDFDASSDDLDADHLTVTYVNLGYVNNSFESEIM